MGKREKKISRFIGRWITEQGAGTVEYVIVVLVAIVIGGGLLTFGNQVSGQVSKTGDSISSWFSKANGTGGTGGGNAGGGGGAADNRIDELKEKDPADWTLDDQKAVAEDIGKKGADGTGKAGLTFLTTSTGIQSRMNAVANNDGGWESSELRQKMNTGEIWNLMPAELQTKVKPVIKLTNNIGGGSDNVHAAVTDTTDKLFLLSYSEIVETPYSGWSSNSWLASEGTQYEVFKGKVTNTERPGAGNKGNNSAISIGDYWWERSVAPYNYNSFFIVNDSGNPSDGAFAAYSLVVCPAFCF